MKKLMIRLFKNVIRACERRDIDPRECFDKALKENKKTMKEKSKFKVTVAHLETNKRQPVATTAHVVDNKGNTAIGLAICSPKDKFNGKIGRKIAVGRAFYAIIQQHDCREINRVEALDQLASTRHVHNVTHKCMYISAVPS